MNSKAKYEYFATHKVGKNYLDFQLATFLGYRIAQGGTGNVVIITGIQALTVLLTSGKKEV